MCSDQDLAGRYPPEYIHTVSTEQAARAEPVFLLARVRGVAVGCAAVIPLDKEVAEVKRLFVEAGYRATEPGGRFSSSCAVSGTRTLRDRAVWRVCRGSPQSLFREIPGNAGAIRIHNAGS